MIYNAIHSHRGGSILLILDGNSEPVAHVWRTFLNYNSTLRLLSIWANSLNRQKYHFHSIRAHLFLPNISTSSTYIRIYGSSEIGTHVRSNLCYLISIGHLIMLTAVTDGIFCFKKTYFPACVRNLFWVTNWYKCHAYKRSVHNKQIICCTSSN